MHGLDAGFGLDLMGAIGRNHGGWVNVQQTRIVAHIACREHRIGQFGVIVFFDGLDQLSAQMQLRGDALDIESARLALFAQASPRKVLWLLVVRLAGMLMCLLSHES